MAEVQIIFEKETQHGIYRDALYFPEDQVPSDEEIERLKQGRVDNWIAVIMAPAVEEPPQDG
jgi:hypothetical protein